MDSKQEFQSALDVLFGGMELPPVESPKPEPEPEPEPEPVDAPTPGRQYRLTGASAPSIAGGNTWAESEVQEVQPQVLDSRARARALSEPEVAPDQPQVVADSKERCSDCGGYLPSYLAAKGILNCHPCQDRTPQGFGPEEAGTRAEAAQGAPEEDPSRSYGKPVRRTALDWAQTPPDAPAPEPPAPVSRSRSGAPRVIGTSNKRGPFWLAVLPHVKGSEFQGRIQRARAAGGWYSRKWSGTPAGFGFRSGSSARAFLDSEAGGPA